ncbi:MAG: hypothetical protein MUC96_08095 [Myxococcaceae bacterium]|nr:hypothetical protein [Myxococcaceae bacterium]
MRELLTRARERFGSDAARYKTREELLAALGLAPGSAVTPAGPAVDFGPGRPVEVQVAQDGSQHLGASGPTEAPSRTGALGTQAVVSAPEREHSTGQTGLRPVGQTSAPEREGSTGQTGLRPLVQTSAPKREDLTGQTGLRPLVQTSAPEREGSTSQTGLRPVAQTSAPQREDLTGQTGLWPVAQTSAPERAGSTVQVGPQAVTQASAPALVVRDFFLPRTR